MRGRPGVTCYCHRNSVIPHERVDGRITKVICCTLVRGRWPAIYGLIWGVCFVPPKEIWRCPKKLNVKEKTRTIAPAM